MSFQIYLHQKSDMEDKAITRNMKMSNGGSQSHLNIRGDIQHFTTNTHFSL